MATPTAPSNPQSGPAQPTPQAPAHAQSKAPGRQHSHAGRHFEHALFYTLAIVSWIFEISAAVIGGYYGGSASAFVGTVTVFLVLHWAAFLQTLYAIFKAYGEGRVEYIWMCRRLQRLMIPTGGIALVTFAIALAYRSTASSDVYWILFLCFFVINTTGSLLNALNIMLAGRRLVTKRAAGKNRRTSSLDIGLAIVGI